LACVGENYLAFPKLLDREIDVVNLDGKTPAVIDRIPVKG
jgi:hypothetical protein